MEVTIRPLKEEDAFTSVKWRNDPEVFKYTGNTYDHEITIENELEWIRKVIANKNNYRCAILADGVYVGNIYLDDINTLQAHYHIFIGNREYWGKGVAKKASKLIIKEAFSQLTVESIILRVKKENTIAYLLYKSLGFVEQCIDGNWLTMVLNK